MLRSQVRQTGIALPFGRLKREQLQNGLDILHQLRSATCDFVVWPSCFLAAQIPYSVPSDTRKLGKLRGFFPIREFRKILKKENFELALEKCGRGDFYPLKLVTMAWNSSIYRLCPVESIKGYFVYLYSKIYCPVFTQKNDFTRVWKQILKSHGKLKRVLKISADLVSGEKWEPCPHQTIRVKNITMPVPFTNNKPCTVK